MAVTLDPPAAARPDGRPARHVPGEAGFWIFIFGDMLVFAALFATYLVQRGKDPAGFAASQQMLNQDIGAINTLLLLVSSLLVLLAVRAVRGGAVSVASWLFGGALACGLGFSVLKVVEWSSKFGDGIKPATNDFFMHYFVLTGLHWFHLLVGMAVLVALIVTARRPEPTSGRIAFIEGGASFWHMVDLLWIVLFPLLLLVK